MGLKDNPFLLKMKYSGLQLITNAFREESVKQKLSVDDERIKMAVFKALITVHYKNDAVEKGI